VSDNVIQFGYTSSELLTGSTPYTTLVHPDDRDRVAREVEHYASGGVDRFQQEYRILTKDGGVRWVDDRTVIERDAEGRIAHYQGILIDITDRMLAKAELQASLREKEVLLREVHHRVKNNMQIISSLLRLQSRQLRSPEAQDVLRESQNRVRSMALVHELLYQSDDLARVNVRPYFKALAHGLYRAYGADAGRIALTLEVDEIFVGMDVAIPCGLVVGELLSNALKHAFPSGRAGGVRLVARRYGESELEISVKDDGVGMDPEQFRASTESLGLRLVRMLAEDQMRGTIQIFRREGTEYRLRFPQEKR
jgi:PAS domain S-box-containing protein